MIYVEEMDYSDILIILIKIRKLKLGIGNWE